MKTKMIMACLAAAMTLVATAAKPAPKKAPVGAQRRAHVTRPARPERRLPPGEQRLLDAIEEADSMRELLPLLPAARKSPNPEIRLAMVSALEDREHRGINELAYFIGDVNPDVSEAAFSAWSQQVGEFDRPTQRVTAICEAARILQAGVGLVPAAPVAVPVAQPVVQPAQPVVAPVAP